MRALGMHIRTSFITTSYKRYNLSINLTGSPRRFYDLLEHCIHQPVGNPPSMPVNPCTLSPHPPSCRNRHAGRPLYSQSVAQVPVLSNTGANPPPPLICDGEGSPSRMSRPPNHACIAYRGSAPFVCFSHPCLACTATALSLCTAITQCVSSHVLQVLRLGLLLPLKW